MERCKWANNAHFVASRSAARFVGGPTACCGPKWQIHSRAQLREPNQSPATLCFNQSIHSPFGWRLSGVRLRANTCPPPAGAQSRVYEHADNYQVHRGWRRPPACKSATTTHFTQQQQLASVQSTRYNLYLASDSKKSRTNNCQICAPIKSN